MAIPDFESLYRAWLHCRKRKKGTAQAQRYEVHLLDNLMTTVQALADNRWQPAPPVCFTVAKPKSREIHAAAFRDRVVHHWLVPQLEALYEPIFIHDVYSNRKGKGTHLAVARLQGMMRSVMARPLVPTPPCRLLPVSDQTPSIAIAPNETTKPSYAFARRRMGATKLRSVGAGNDQSNAQERHRAYFLQLDIKNFFNAIDRPTLFKLIQQRLKKAIKKGHISIKDAAQIRHLTHTILKQEVGDTAILVASQKEWQAVPAHKRLINAGKDKGVPIGNLTSQFFANVYLNELDQFVKHQLTCRHYLRYVDDFILLHQSPQQLLQWQQQIIAFLAERLQLMLRKCVNPQPVTNGADFLGYIIKPNVILVRKRVIVSLYDKLYAIEKKMLKTNKNNGIKLTLSTTSRNSLQSMLASYIGHFSHAHCYSLIASLLKRFSWLDLLFKQHKQGLIPRWEPPSVSSYQSQLRYFRKLYPNARILIQRGTQTDQLLPRKPSHLRQGVNTNASQVSFVWVKEAGYLKGGLKRRLVSILHYTLHRDIAP